MGDKERVELKARLSRLERTQMSLLKEVRKYGWPKLSYQLFNAYMTGARITPQGDAVLEVCGNVIEKWERDTKEAM
mgnify:CR=1 FL=1